jgi:hypothetical protein
MKFRWNRTMLNLCGIVVAILKMATGRNFSMSGHIESSTGKSARQGNLRHPRVWCRRFPCLALFASVWFYFSLLLAVFSFVFVYVLLANDHVNNVSYFPFMSIKKVVPYFCVLHEGYVIIWLIVRICVFIKDWKLIYSKLFILKRKNMKNCGGGAVDINCSLHLPVKRTWFFLSYTSAR